jgi:hypothetical protein
MQEFSDELSWWLEPEVVSKPDLSQYREEIDRIREASRVVLVCDHKPAWLEGIECLFGRQRTRMDV